MDTSTYKRQHEEFMMNLNGTSAAEVFFVILPAPVCIFLSAFIFSFLSLLFKPSWNVSSTITHTNKLQFLVDFIVIVVPMVFYFTVLSDHHVIITVTLLMGLFVCVVYQCTFEGRGLHRQYINEVLASPIDDPKRPFITNFRALANLMTAICILAVDFKIFPRRFAKTENFGYGLMDTGVGLFIISNALVTSQVEASIKLKSFSLTMWRTVKSTIPLFILGGLRFFATKQVDYQTHVSEYGVHWNFFITLAVTRIICTFILNIVGTNFTFVLPVIVITIHELVLISGSQDWVISNTPRENIFSANREGIVSALGYVAIYFAGVYLGNELKDSKSNFEDNLISVGKLTIVNSLLWSVNTLSRHCFGVSRRLANVGYFTWILALSSSMIVILLGIELLIRALNVISEQNIKQKKGVTIGVNICYVPIILDAINFNGLTFFLLANIMTGLVNITFHTLYLDVIPSILILCGYSLVLCWITVLMYCKKIKLKFW